MHEIIKLQEALMRINLPLGSLQIVRKGNWRS